MLVSEKIKVLSCNSCTTTETRLKKKEGVDRKDWPAVQVEIAHASYGSVVEKLQSEASKKLHELMYEVFDNDDNYGKQVSISIECSVAVADQADL
jgi:hypothetical protein